MNSQFFLMYIIHLILFKQCVSSVSLSRVPIITFQSFNCGRPVPRKLVWKSQSNKSLNLTRWLILYLWVGLTEKKPHISDCNHSQTSELHQGDQRNCDDADVKHLLVTMLTSARTMGILQTYQDVVWRHVILTL